MSRRLQLSPRSDRKYELDGQEYSIDDYDMTPRDAVFKDIDTRKVLEIVLDEEKEEIIEEVKDTKEKKYENLTEEEEAELRCNYAVKRTFILSKYKIEDKDIPNYTSNKFSVKKMVEIHNRIVSQFSTMNKIRNYKAVFMGIVAVAEKICIAMNYTFVEGVSNIQASLMDNYDEIIMELANNKSVNSLISSSNPSYSLIITLLLNITCIVIILLLSKLHIPKEYSMSIMKKIIDTLNPTNVNKVSADGLGIVEDNVEGISSSFNGIGAMIDGISSVGKFVNNLAQPVAQQPRNIVRP